VIAWPNDPVLLLRQSEMSTLERAIAIAAEAGQTDKTGAPYILHPLCMSSGVL
jgi:(p)ppGpp synthase/HD superfamily hydrolase